MAGKIACPKTYEGPCIRVDTVFIKYIIDKSRQLNANAVLDLKAENLTCFILDYFCIFSVNVRLFDTPGWSTDEAYEATNLKYFDNMTMQIRYILEDSNMPLEMERIFLLFEDKDLANGKLDIVMVDYMFQFSAFYGLQIWSAIVLLSQRAKECEKLKSIVRNELEVPHDIDCIEIDIFQNKNQR